MCSDVSDKAGYPADAVCFVCGHRHGLHEAARKHCPKVDASASHDWPWRDTVFVPQPDERLMAEYAAAATRALAEDTDEAWAAVGIAKGRVRRAGLHKDVCVHALSERARIVAWIREHAGYRLEPVAMELADWIERGEHG